MMAGSSLQTLARLAASTPHTPHPTHTHSSNPHPQARSDYGKHRMFFKKSGKAIEFVSPQQVGAGAAQATSPEVSRAVVEGPDQEAEEDVTMWQLLQGCDTWAAGRMVFELLLQCVHRVAKASTGVGLPALGKDGYKDTDLPPLPGYSDALRSILVGMAACKPEDRLTPR